MVSIDSCHIASEDHAAFLSLAARDDAFRHRLTERPAETLAELGIAIDARRIPAAVRLPNKDSLRASSFIPWRGILA